MKASIVFRSEFLRRVRSKWFVLTTLLAPVFFVGLMVVPPLVGFMASGGSERVVAIVDETGVLATRLIERSSGELTFVEADVPTDSLRAAVESGRYNGYLILPESLLTGEEEARYYSVEGGGLSLGARLETEIDEAVTEHRLQAQNVSPEIRSILESTASVDLLKLTEEGTATESAAASSILGMAMGFVIYIAMFIYGAYVMHGVMEEKQSRVLEVIVSSVRPFDLLMGKVLAIGAMGLLQMSVWLAILLGLSVSAGGLLTLFIDPSDFNLPDGVSGDELAAAADIGLPQISPELFLWFILFFLGGYLLYSSLFAAVGASVDNQQDAQTLIFPVSILIIIPMFFITVIVEDPNGTLAAALSMVPFFAPVLMVMRLAITSVPTWQILLSFLILCATFVGSIWVCGRIYRVGILMYGKKPSLRDLVRWFRYQ